MASGQFPGFKSKSSDPNQTIDQFVGTLLNENLPLVLNANNAYPTVPAEDMLGGPFNGQPLAITMDTLTKPLPPGDYVVPMTFFCSEYSVHRPGGGIAYTLGPATGSAAKAISTMLWRGVLTGRSPQELQTISWAIQGGVPYDKMPMKYRRTIDELIPDMKGDINGQGFAKIQNEWNNFVNGGAGKFSKLTHVRVQANIPLEAVFARLGPLGRLALDSERITNTFGASYVNDQMREQTLFAGQGSQLPPLPAVDGPWSVKVPGVAYMRFVVKSGNLKGDNVMEIRILNSQRTVAQDQSPPGPHVVLTSYGGQAPVVAQSPSLVGMFGGTVNQNALSACVGLRGAVGSACEANALTVAGVTGYAVGGTGAQAPIMAPSSPLQQPASDDGCETALANLAKVKLPHSDPVSGFVRNQTCIATTACRSTKVKNRPWINSVVQDFVEPFTALSGDWLNQEEKCSTTNMPVRLSQFMCQMSMAEYHMSVDLQNALDKDGCGSDEDWDSIADIIGGCIDTGIKQDMIFGTRPIATISVTEYVKWVRDSIRKTCIQHRTAAGMPLQ